MQVIGLANDVTATRAHWRAAAPELAKAGQRKLARWLEQHFRAQPWPEHVPERITSSDILTTLVLQRALEASRAAWRRGCLAEVEKMREEIER